MAHRDQDVFAALLVLAGTDPGRHDVGAVVDALVQAGGEVLGADQVVVLLGRGEAGADRAASGPGLLVAGASSRVAHALGRVQLRSGGPVDEAHRAGLAVHLRGAPDPRWPALTEQVAVHGLRSVSAVPVRVGEQAVGAFCLFWAEAGLPAAEEDPVLEALGRMAAVGIVNRRHVATLDERADQLTQALESRVLIEQAKGMLAARSGLDVTGAFELMRSQARARRMTLAAIAAEVLRGLADGVPPNP